MAYLPVFVTWRDVGVKLAWVTLDDDNGRVVEEFEVLLRRFLFLGVTLSTSILE
jgi:hypothetical protein